MTTYEAGTYRIYTRETIDDSWTERTMCYLMDDVHDAANYVPTLRIRVPYAASTANTQFWYQDFANHWVRITYEPSGGSETDIWYGSMVASIINEETMEMEWAAAHILSQLVRVDLGSFAYADPQIAGDAMCKNIALQIFNLDLERNLKSADEWYLAPSESHYMHKKIGADAQDWLVYIFGTDSLWDNYEILRFLLATYVPKGSTEFCEIGFALAPTAAAKTYLQAAKQEWNFSRMNLWEAVDKLVRSSGPLAWCADWSTSGDYGYDYVRLRVFSKKYEDKDDTWQNEHALLSDPTAPDCEASRIQVRTGDKISKLVVYGEPIRIMMTMAGPDLGVTTLPNYEKGWDDAEEAAWDEFDPERDENWPNVFRRLLLDWDANITSWNHVWLEPGTWPGSYETEEGDMCVKGADHYARARRILKRCLTHKEYGYENQDDSAGTALVVTPGGTGKPEFEPILGWFVPDAGDAESDPKQILKGRIRPLADDFGVLLPTSVRDVEVSDLFLDQDDRWKRLYITFAVEGDIRLAYEMTAYDEGDHDQMRTVEVYEPGAEWWAAAEGTKLEYDSVFGWTLIYGVLRNDLPKLKARAENIIKHHNEQLYRGTFVLKQVDVAKKVGDYITTYGPWTINQVIMSVLHALASTERWGTRLTTQKHWSRRNAP